ncbi:hypothetical protein R3P38DRAFT_2902138, partial [Favolaschia claudopus]
VKQSLSARDSADRLAAHLGLTTTGEFKLRKYKDCLIATDEMRQLFGDLVPGDSEEPSHPIVSAFCANYLPSLVNAYMENYCPEGPYHRLLVGILQSSYFAKYFRTPAGSDLYAFYVGNILLSTHEEPLSPFTVGLLILATYAHEYKAYIEPLPDHIVTQLKCWVREQGQKSIDFLRPSLCLMSESEVLAQLSDDPEAEERMSSEFDNHKRNLDMAISILNILDGRLKNEARQLTLTRGHVFERYAQMHKEKVTGRRSECVRCQTVAYCCREHQREDWTNHKERCFKTVY